MTRLTIITGVLLALGLSGLGAGLLTSGALSARPPDDRAAAEPPTLRTADAPPATDDDKGPPTDPQLARNEAESRDNLKQLAIAMHNYNDVYGHRPRPPSTLGNNRAPAARRRARGPA